MSDKEPKVTYTPSDEPYLGRELLYHFDQLISCCLEQNALVAPATHKIQLHETQKMACQVIPQSISIALSIRELVRQGYLFGAHIFSQFLIQFGLDQNKNYLSSIKGTLPLASYTLSLKFQFAECSRHLFPL